MPVSPPPAVTVIIATYNKEKTLPHSVNSVLWQTFDDFECLVIGDACTDHSEDVIAAIDDPRVSWINLEQNSGYQSAPTNEGLRRARGQYIAYLNDDDIWLPNHLELLISELENKSADFAYAIIERFDTEKVGHVDVPNFPHAARPPEASATLHRHAVISKIGFWKLPAETRMNPRIEWFRSAQLAGYKFVLVPALTVLKFGTARGQYGKAGPQREFMQAFSDDPRFVERELGKLLAQAVHELNGPISLHQLKHQLLQTVRLNLLRRNIDPGHLAFWRKPGQRIKKWRRFQGLDDA